jgi:transcription elongation factor Elf1
VVSTVCLYYPSHALSLVLVLILACPDLSAAVDVYSDWVDACDDVAKRAAADGGGGEYQGGSSQRVGGGARREVASDEEGDPEEMDDFIENDEMDAEAEYAT